MKCEDCLVLIEEYFDAELNNRESAKVAEHLTACVTCNGVYESLQQEQQLYTHYQRDVEVTSGFWQVVQASIKQEAARQETRQPIGVVERLRRFFTETFHAPRFSPALAAMLVVIAIGATVLVMNYVNSHSNSTKVARGNNNSDATVPANPGNDTKTPQTTEAASGRSGPKVESPTTPAIQPGKGHGIESTPVKATSDSTKQRSLPVAKDLSIKPNATAEALLHDAEQKYIAAIAILQRDFDKRRSKLDPKLVAKLETSLASIDRTITETRKAVRQNSDDPIAVQYMLTAYAKKVEVLRDVTED
jgi:Putative zinc-finger